MPTYRSHHRNGQNGESITDPEAYNRIQSYAPYENLAQAEYPPVLVTAGLTDPRVTYWEPMKYVARLREYSTNPVYLRMEPLGHGGASGRFGPLGEVAECYSWVLEPWASGTKTGSDTPV